MRTRKKGKERIERGKANMKRQERRKKGTENKRRVKVRKYSGPEKVFKKR
jgi:hypothetical protein